MKTYILSGVLKKSSPIVLSVGLLSVVMQPFCKASTYTSLMSKRLLFHELEAFSTRHSAFSCDSRGIKHDTSLTPVPYVLLTKTKYG